jgi:serine/threonine protein phosphatase PrpC
VYGNNFGWSTPLEPKLNAAFTDSFCEVHVISVCGPVREENQDAGVAWRSERDELVVIVSDGMGGHAAGREAAEIVIRASLDAIRSRVAGTWETVFREAVRTAQETVHETARSNSVRSMGATVALALIEGLSEAPLLHIAHVGDSRVYLHRGRSIYRLTSDHSLVAQMVRDGLLREEEAFGHPDSNIIQRAIGQERPLDPEIQKPVPLDAGDVVLVCSDGLHGVVPDAGIEQAIARSRSAVETCEQLLAAALEAGSQDNITIGCIRVGPEGATRRPTRVHF